MQVLSILNWELTLSFQVWENTVLMRYLTFPVVKMRPLWCMLPPMGECSQGGVSVVSWQQHFHYNTESSVNVQWVRSCIIIIRSLNNITKNVVLKCCYWLTAKNSLEKLNMQPFLFLPEQFWVGHFEYLFASISCFSLFLHSIRISVLDLRFVIILVLWSRFTLL